MSEAPLYGTDPSEMRCLFLQGYLASKKAPRRPPTVSSPPCVPDPCTSGSGQDGQSRRGRRPGQAERRGARRCCLAVMVRQPALPLPLHDHVHGSRVAAHRRSKSGKSRKIFRQLPGRARLIPGRTRFGTDWPASGLVTHMRTHRCVLFSSLSPLFPWNSFLEKESPRLETNWSETEPYGKPIWSKNLHSQTRPLHANKENETRRQGPDSP